MAFSITKLSRRTVEIVLRYRRYSSSSISNIMMTCSPRNRVGRLHTLSKCYTLHDRLHRVEMLNRTLDCCVGRRSSLRKHRSVGPTSFLRCRVSTIPTSDQRRTDVGASAIASFHAVDTSRSRSSADSVRKEVVQSVQTETSGVTHRLDSSGSRQSDST